MPSVPATRAASLLLLLCSCGPSKESGKDKGPLGSDPWATDLGRSSGYQDHWFGHYKNGRGSVVADFDGDGDNDVFSGNPGNESFLLRNITEPGGPVAFEPWQVLSESELFYGGVAADFDNDGDPDLFISAGANDGKAPDRLFRNDFGQGAPDDAPLVDVSGPELIPTKADGTQVPNGTMGARAFDVDHDGLLDLWASNFAGFAEIDGLPPEELLGLNQLYINQGDLLLEDRAWELGIHNQAGTRHSSILDYDLDGDWDIYENNFVGKGVFYENQLVEDGTIGFLPAHHELSLGDSSLTGAFLNQAMCSFPVDLDNDGWDDLLLLHRGNDNNPNLAIPGHQVFMNQQGQGFIDVLEHTGLSARFDEFYDAGTVTSTEVMGSGWGVMGCQVGDVNLDGFPDVFIGTGVGYSGDVNRLFVQTGRELVQVDESNEVMVPIFEEWTDRLDVPVDPIAGAPDVVYPYRTHGSSFADYDGDGIPELGVHNGGPSIADFPEPNRLWQFHHDDPRFLRVTVQGDGVSVNRDGIGARVKLTVERDRDGATWDLYQTRRAGSGFGAQNEPQLTFGLGDGDRVTAIEVLWPDGETLIYDPPAGTQGRITVSR